MGTMRHHDRPPAGPRGIVGAAAEEAAAAHLARQGWTIAARNVRIGEDELDIVAVDPVPRPTLVIVEVRSRSGARFGAAVESVDARKVARLYRAAGSLRRDGGNLLPPECAAARAWRIDLLALHRSPGSAWTIDVHLRGLAPP
jgi:putative endonuclease